MGVPSTVEVANAQQAVDAFRTEINSAYHQYWKRAGEIHMQRCEEGGVEVYAADAPDPPRVAGEQLMVGYSAGSTAEGNIKKLVSRIQIASDAHLLEASNRLDAARAGLVEAIKRELGAVIQPQSR